MIKKLLYLVNAFSLGCCSGHFDYDRPMGDDGVFGARLRLAMQMRGVSQNQLAQWVGMTQGGIQGLFARDEPSKQVVALADALCVRPQWLAHGEEPMEDGFEASESLRLFADRLNLARRQRGLDYPVLGRLAGVRAKRLQLLEGAQAEPTVDELMGLRTALEMTLDYLVAGLGRVEIEELSPASPPRHIHERKRSGSSRVKD